MVQLQNEDGSFNGDKWGEVDTRFSMCAVACLALLVRGLIITGNKFQTHSTQCLQGRLDAINIDKAVSFVISCMNFDGGFGCRPGSESHAGHVSIKIRFPIFFK